MMARLVISSFDNGSSRLVVVNDWMGMNLHSGGLVGSSELVERRSGV